MATNVKDYYAALGITADADAETIKKAFLTQARQFTDGNDPKARLLKEAYEVLSDPAKRKQYNSRLKHQQTSENKAAPSGAPGDLQMWEYLTVSSSRNYGTTKYYINDVQEPSLKNAKFSYVINMFGGEGWELVGISSMDNTQIYVFKRPTDEVFVPEKDKPTA